MKSKWNDSEALKFTKKFKNKNISKELAYRIYSSRLLGNDSSLVLHGGGNTSLKSKLMNSQGLLEEIIYVKGSGKDMSNITPSDFPSLELKNLLKLKKMKKINDFQMLNYQKKYMVDTSFPNSSIETLLHAFLPFKYVDHCHSTAILSIINQPQSISICNKVFGKNYSIVPYIMPGFDLSKKAIEIFEKNPNILGLILLNHGIFTFGNTAKQSYERMIKCVSLAEKELKNQIKKKKYIKYSETKINTSKLANLLRKYTSINKGDDFERKIITYSELPFINNLFSIKYNGGPTTPDHVIRIKHKPLFLDFSKIKKENIENTLSIKIYKYQKEYIKYFNRNKHLNKNAIMHDPNPRIIVVKGIGIFATGKNYKESRIALDIGINSISTIFNSAQYGRFKSIKEKEIFQMEYWPLELAKIKNINSPLEGNVTIITGGLGTIGYSIAKKFLKEGSEVVLLDKIKPNKIKKNIKDMSYFQCDITKNNKIKKVLNLISKKYGGIDIVISNAGFAIQKPLEDINKLILNKSFSINFFAHHFLAQQCVEILKNQSTGGSILFNISKQSINPGKNFASYGLPKATLMFLMKQYALEFSKFGIRFNGVNADRIKSGLLNIKLIQQRAKTRKLSVNQYLSANLLKKEVKPDDVANAFFYLSKSLKTTACVITVDGGNIEASLR